MASADTKRKATIYSINFLTPSAINFIKSFSSAAKTIKNIPALEKILDTNIANPIGAAYFGVLDILGAFSDKIKNSKFTRLSKVAGLGIYGTQTALDIFSIANGNYQDIAKLFYDGSMAYVLGKESSKAYVGGKQDLWKDLTKW